VRVRPSYGQAALGWVVGRLKPVTGPVADIGAGTGALSHLLFEQGHAVVAVDPVKARLDRCPATLPRVQAVAGWLPFPDRSLRAITAVMAFHWFATSDTLDEFHRCRSIGASAILAWNERDERVPWVAARTVLVDQCAGNTPRFRHDAVASGYRRPLRLPRGRVRRVPQSSAHDSSRICRPDPVDLVHRRSSLWESEPRTCSS
jgi:SAM-dependent methyltransferase